MSFLTKRAGWGYEMEVTAGPVMLSLSLVLGLDRLATGEVGWEGGSCVVLVVVVGGGVDSLVMI